MKKSILVVCISILLATSSLSSAGSYSVVSLGTCAVFVNSYEYFKTNLLDKEIYGEDIGRFGEYMRLKGYIVGFVTGTNAGKARIISSAPVDWEMYLSNYCKENPLDLLMVALTKLDEELDK